MREPKGDWRDLFNGFMVALDLRKMLFAFMGLLFTILLIGVITYVWCVALVPGAEVTAKVGDQVEPVIPKSFTPHAITNWFAARWAGHGNANGIYDMHPVNWGCYTIIVLAVFFMIWSYFGGAIARSAACEIAREGERIETSKALKYSGRKFWSFFGAPLICVLGFLFFYLVTYVAGLVFRVFDIIYIGAPLAAIFFPLAVLAGFIMALIVVGSFAGLPLFAPAVATEGTDAFDAFSRGFSYIYSKPWHYLWYQLVGGVYGYVCIAFVVLFTVFMTSLGMSAGEAGFRLSGVWTDKTEKMVQEEKDSGTRVNTDFEAITNWAWSYVLSREHAEGTYGWTPSAIASDPHPYGRIMHLSTKLADCEGVDFDATLPTETRLHFIAAPILLAWLIVIMGLAYSFAVSYFFSQQTMIYFILRKKVDDIDVKEVYLEEEFDQLETPPEAPAETKPEEGAPEETKPAPKPAKKTARKTRKSTRKTGRKKR